MPIGEARVPRLLAQLPPAPV